MAKKTGKKTKEVAEFPGVSGQTINVLKKAGKVLHIKVERKTRIILGLNHQMIYGK